MTQPPHDQNHIVPPPVTYFPEDLPLADPNLPWERFEAFSEEFISRLPGVVETHRYGRQGSGQRGIDIFAYFENGEKWAFQCRQRRSFTASNATTAIEDTTYTADRFILMLSRTATSSVRDVYTEYPSWDIWDVGDISRKVRELEMNSAARLVETHFGVAWRSAFLGLHGLTSFLSPDEFFQSFLNTSALFNHAWDLVGRSQHLSEAHEFVGSRQQKVAILVGRGGIGKSKFLHAFSETFDDEHDGMSLWFAAEGLTLTPEGADHLPYSPCVIVMDDAHRRSDLPTLLAMSRQRSHPVKLLLSCRPQGLSPLRSQLSRVGFDVQEIAELPAISELTREEVTQLGRQSLGSEFAFLADKLAAATWDCPLVTVIGGQLLARRAIAPELLERDEEFRQTVLTRFRDILVGEVGNQIDPTLCRDLLDLIASVQPIRVNNEQALNAEAEFLGVSRPSLLSNLGILEEAGVLLRRGYTLRIVPDVLADHILHNANVTPQGQLTGYADLIFEKFASLCPSELLRNLSELDWRLRSSDAQAADLLGRVWRKIEQEFRDAPNSGRCSILKILREVAVYQPAKTLELVEFAMRNTATASENLGLSQFYEYTHDDVLHELPALLRRVCFNIDFIHRCCGVLWELGRDDVRRLNQLPDHPMRVLADLGSYEIGKPYIVNEKVLDAVEEMLETPGFHGHAHSPLAIIDPMMAKTGSSAHSEGHSFVYRSFVLRIDGIREIRQRALSLIVRCLRTGDLKATLRSLQSLEGTLREPVAEFNTIISDEDREQWRTEQLEILNHIADLAERSTEPVTLLEIRSILSWHRNYSPSDDIKRISDDIVSSISETFEFRLSQHLMNSFPLEVTESVTTDSEDRYRFHQEQIDLARRAFVDEFLNHSVYPQEAYNILTDRIRTMVQVGIQLHPQLILGLLGRSDPEFAASLCDIVVDNSDGEIAPYLNALLTPVRIWSAERARDIDQRALEEGSTVLCGGVALSYRSGSWTDNATETDIENIKELLNHGDIGVKGAAIAALNVLAEVRRQDAIELASAVEIGDSDFLANELCQLFYGGWTIPFDELTPDDIGAILSKLEDVNEIQEYMINTFLVRASEVDARAVVGLLLNRIMNDRNSDPLYHALPLLGFDQPLTGFSTSSEREDILRGVRDISVESSPAIRYWLPELFREISLGFKSDAALNVLNEWVNSGSPEKIRAASQLTFRAHPNFVFENVEFVSNLLECAHVANEETFVNVSGDLMASASSGTRSGTPGEPFPEDVALRDNASAIADQFDLGSPANRFYASLAQNAEATIQDHLLRDAEEAW